MKLSCSYFSKPLKWTRSMYVRSLQLFLLLVTLAELRHLLVIFQQLSL